MTEQNSSRDFSTQRWQGELGFCLFFTGHEIFRTRARGRRWGAAGEAADCNAGILWGQLMCLGPCLHPVWETRVELAIWGVPWRVAAPCLCL